MIVSNTSMTKQKPPVYLLEEQYYMFRKTKLYSLYIIILLVLFVVHTSLSVNWKQLLCGGKFPWMILLWYIFSAEGEEMEATRTCLPRLDYMPKVVYMKQVASYVGEATSSTGNESQTAKHSCSKKILIVDILHICSYFCWKNRSLFVALACQMQQSNMQIIISICNKQ